MKVFWIELIISQQTISWIYRQLKPVKLLQQSQHPFYSSPLNHPHKMNFSIISNNPYNIASVRKAQSQVPIAIQFSLLKMCQPNCL